MRTFAWGVLSSRSIADKWYQVVYEYNLASTVHDT